VEVGSGIARGVVGIWSWVEVGGEGFWDGDEDEDSGVSRPKQGNRECIVLHRANFGVYENKRGWLKRGRSAQRPRFVSLCFILRAMDRPSMERCGTIGGRMHQS
jgi:hypothetical protein